VITEPVELTSAGGIRLSAEIDWPDVPGRVPLVAFAHGWGSGKGSPRNRAVAERLALAGIAALRLDFTGHGESGGHRAQSTWEQQAADLKAALDYALSRPEVSAAGLAGSSTGGIAAMMLAAADDRVRALVLREPRTEGAGDLAPRIKAPTLILQGGAASPLAADIHRLSRQLLGPHRLVVIEGGGHLFEDPATFRVVLAQTVAWFEEHLLGRAPA